MPGAAASAHLPDAQTSHWTLRPCRSSRPPQSIVVCGQRLRADRARAQFQHDEGAPRELSIVLERKQRTRVRHTLRKATNLIKIKHDVFYCLDLLLCLKNLWRFCRLIACAIPLWFFGLQNENANSLILISKVLANCFNKDSQWQCWFTIDKIGASLTFSWTISHCCWSKRINAKSVIAFLTFVFALLTSTVHNSSSVSNC